MLPIRVKSARDLAGYFEAAGWKTVVIYLQGIDSDFDLYDIDRLLKLAAMKPPNVLFLEVDCENIFNRRELHNMYAELSVPTIQRCQPDRTPIIVFRDYVRAQWVQSIAGLERTLKAAAADPGYNDWSCEDCMDEACNFSNSSSGEDEMCYD